MLNERLQILIRPDQRRRLDSEAKRRGTSVAALVREAVDAQLGTVSRAERIEAVRRMGKLHGKFLSPEELNAIAEEEQEEELEEMLSAGR